MRSEDFNSCFGTYTGLPLGRYRVVFEGDGTGAATGGSTDDTGGKVIAPVPYEDFRRKNEALKEANAVIAQLSEQVAALESASAEGDDAQEELSPFIERSEFDSWKASQRQAAEKAAMDYQLQYLETKLDETIEQHPELDRNSLEIRILKNPKLLQPKEYKEFITLEVGVAKDRDQKVIAKYIEGKKAIPVGSPGGRGSMSPETQPKTFEEARASARARFAAADAGGD